MSVHRILNVIAATNMDIKRKKGFLEILAFAITAIAGIYLFILLLNNFHFSERPLQLIAILFMNLLMLSPYLAAFSILHNIDDDVRLFSNTIPITPLANRISIAIIISGIIATCINYKAFIISRDPFVILCSLLKIISLYVSLILISITPYLLSTGLERLFNKKGDK